jgi:DNA repair protein RecN (Recombination protein N)
MLRGLDIRDMLIIDRLELSFQPGLNVLTGETGAGKSILLDSLGFVLGWRGRAELVRAGAARGEVTACFDLTPDHPAQRVLEEAGFEPCEELILRRVNSKDGRKSAWINDRRCSGDVLRALSETLVELHGQNDDRGLLNPRGHRLLLDDFAGVSKEIAKSRSCWAALATSQKALDIARAALDEVRAEEEFLRHAVEELDQLAPEPGEEATLDTERRRMQASERIAGDLDKAAQSLSWDGAEGMLSTAQRWLESVADNAEGRLTAPLEALSRAISELDEAAQGVERCREDMRFDASELEDCEERLFAIRGMARKHAVQPDELATFADGLRARLERLDHGAQDLQLLDSEVTAAQLAYAAAADALTTKRRKSAQRLDRAMAQELKPLKMERALFETVVTRSAAGPEGQDAVAFTVATNPGAPAGPLNKIASGGELSRFLLALKVCLSKETQGVTMIFDEIDRGVGGATADAVGRRLAELARGTQVLVVTHSPQVAALGDHHWRVEKRVKAGMTTSTVVALPDQARMDEIARMLAGDTITEEARAAARALLNG